MRMNGLTRRVQKLIFEMWSILDQQEILSFKQDNMIDGNHNSKTHKLNSTWQPQVNKDTSYN